MKASKGLKVGCVYCVNKDIYVIGDGEVEVDIVG